MSRAEDQSSPVPDRITIPPGHAWSRLPWIGAAVAAVGLVASFLLWPGHPEQFFHSWLVSFMFFLSLALGGLFFVLTHFVTRAAWSVTVRRLAENIMATLPLFVVLFIPVVVGMRVLFPWTDPELVAHDSLLRGKQGYLNTTFFLWRAAAYFAIWTLLALWFGRRSSRQDATGDKRTTLRSIQVSAPSLVLFAFTVTFAAVDWIMSLDPHWYSTMFGVYYFAGSLVGIFALMSLMAVGLRNAGLVGQAINVEHLHDLGKLLFAFTVFWAYIAFSQYFLIWYGNIPEETVWYLHRSEGAWKAVSAMLGWGHFGVPFLFLMSRTIKRNGALLVCGSVWMLFMHYVDLYWMIMPALHTHDVHVSMLDVTTLLAIGGAFVAVVGWQLRRRALIPVRDPRLAESLGFENV